MLLHGRNGNPQFWHLLLWCPPSTLSNFSTLGPNLLALAKLRSNTLPRQAMAGCWIDAQGGRCEVHHRTKGLEQWCTVLLLSPYGQWAHIITVTANNSYFIIHHCEIVWISTHQYPINRTTPHLQTSALGYWFVTCSSSFYPHLKKGRTRSMVRASDLALDSRSSQREVYRSVSDWYNSYP